MELLASDDVCVLEEGETLHQPSDLLNSVTITSPGTGLDVILGSETMVEIVISNKNFDLNHTVSSCVTGDDQNVSDNPGKAKLLYLKSVEFPTENTSCEAAFKLHAVSVSQSSHPPALQLNSSADCKKNRITSGDCQQMEADLASHPPPNDNASVILDDLVTNNSIRQTVGYEIFVAPKNNIAAPATDLNCKSSSSSLASRPSLALPAHLIPGRKVCLGVMFTASTLGYTRQKCLLTFVQDCGRPCSNSGNDLFAETETRGAELEKQVTSVMDADPPSIVTEKDSAKFETSNESWLSCSETPTSQGVNLPLPRSRSLLEASIEVFLEVNVLDPLHRELLQQIASSSATKEENCSEATESKSASRKEKIVEGKASKVITGRPQ